MSSDAGCDSSSVNVTVSPSSTGPSDVTVNVTSSFTIRISADTGVPSATAPVVLAPVSVTDSVSPRSRNPSATVGIAIVPVLAPAPIVSVPDGAS